MISRTVETAPTKHGAYLVADGRREIIFTAVLTLLSSAAVIFLAIGQSPWWGLLEIPILLAAATGVLFFRNPRRRIPSEEGLLVSPADGRVVEISECEETDFPGGPAYRIGIFLSIFDVHINRSPCGGKVETVVPRPGKYHNAMSQAAAAENASNLIGLTVEEPGVPEGTLVGVKQIAGLVARQIVCDVRPGTSLVRGQRIGMIKYGSRTELYVPMKEERPFQVEVRVGDRVRGGSTVLGRWSS